MTPEWSPGDLAAFDQFLAGADGKLDIMARAMRDGIHLEGAPSAMATVHLLLARLDSDTLAGMLTVAIRRIAMSEQRD